MKRKSPWKNCISAALSLLLLLPQSVKAAAERPENAPAKGSGTASALPVIERNDEKNAAYPLEEISVERVLIGLKYDRQALYEAYFYNPSGDGFAIGAYDADRVFHASLESESSTLTVYPERLWRVLYDERFSDETSAKSFAASRDATVVSIDGEYRVVYGYFDSSWEAEDHIRWYGIAGRVWLEERIAFYDGSGKLVYRCDMDDTPALRARGGEKSLTWFDEESYRGGFILRADDEKRLIVINVVALEDYVKGVVPYEMSPSWPIEALKAQAVCARTYVAYNLNAYEEYGFDLTADTMSQVYRGVNGADAVTDAAVDATAGQFIRYQGELCDIYYFASDGGATEDGAGVYAADHPYLLGKLDPFEYAVEFAIIEWERWLDGDDIGARLRHRGEEIGDVIALTPEYSELGNVIAVSYSDEQGRTVRREGRESYDFLGLSNCRFQVESYEGGGFYFTGRGWGHNCGMSQWGANAMAGVYGYDYQEIIGFYFTGAYCA